MALRKSGIEEEFTDMWLGTVPPKNEEQTEYRLKLRDVALRGNPWCLVVVGSKGNGKSYYAQIAVNTFNNNGYKGGYYSTQPLMESELRAESKENTYKRYCEYPLLVIDELSDRPNDWTEFIKTNIESILIERHRRKNPTILIGNITLERLMAMFDVRIRDRLKEGLFQIMVGKSLRKVNEANK